MQKRKVMSSTSCEEMQSLRPAITPEGEESQMISLAMKLVKKRLLEGTATSQETTHFLKLGTVQHKLEEEKLKKEIELLDAKKQTLESQEKEAEKFDQAIKAFGIYSGDDNFDDVQVLDSEGEA